MLLNPATWERRLRLIENEEDHRRVCRQHPHGDRPLLRALRNDLEDRFQTAGTSGSSELHGSNGGGLEATHGQMGPHPAS